MLKTNDGYIEVLQVSECRPLLRRELRNAYHIFANIEINGLTRMIAHQPASHAPSAKLPWPFSKLVMHDVAITHFKADADMETKRFTKHQIDAAIEEFLSGVPVNERVIITVENS